MSETANVEQLNDSLEMSDDDFLKQEAQLHQIAEAAEASGAATRAAEDDEADTKTQEDEDDSTEETQDLDDSDNDGDSESDDDDTTDEQTDDSEADENDESEESQSGDSSGEDDASDNETSDKDETDTENADSEVDYKAELDKLLAPFKASGRTIKVDNTDDALNLMRMGADYNQKMRRIKPLVKTAKMLEANDLLNNPTKLNHLIDASKGDKAAIIALAKEHGIESLDIDETETSDNYQPKDYSIDDNTYNLSEVLDTIRGTEKFDVTSKIIGHEWDSNSRAQLFDNPSTVAIIHDHVQTGFYDEVSAEVERMRTLGKIPENVADIDAYGAIAKLLTEQKLAEQNTSSKQSEQKAEQNKQASAKRDKQRKAAGATRKQASPAKPKVTGQDILSMSDEDFEKVSAQDLFKIVT